MNRRLTLSLLVAGLAIGALLSINKSHAIGDMPMVGAEGTQTAAVQAGADPPRADAAPEAGETQPHATPAPTPEELAQDARIRAETVSASEGHRAANQTAVLEGSNQEQPKAPRAGPGPEEAPILVSRRLSYQAVLTDNLGNALPGPVNLAFRIYTSGGVLVEGPINVAGVPVNDGVVDTSFPVSAATFDGSDRLLGVTVGAGPELAPRITLTSVPYALRVDRVLSEELDDNITLGRGAAPLATGSLSIQNGVIAQPSIQMTGSTSQISTYGSDGLERIRLLGPSFGEIQLRDSTGNNNTVTLSATSNAGGTLTLRNSDATLTGILLEGDDGGTNDGGSLTINQADGTIGVLLDSDATNANGGADIEFRAGDGSISVFVDGDSGGSGLVNVRNSAGSNRVTLDADATGTDGGGSVTVGQADGSTGVIVDGDATNADGGGEITVHNNVSVANISITGETGRAQAVDSFDVVNNIDGVVVGSLGRFSTLGGRFNSYDETGVATAIVGSSTAAGGFMYLYQAGGALGMNVDGDSTGANGGGVLNIYDSTGAATITLDGDFGGDGRVITQELQLTGGSDLSEQFDVTSPEGEVKPGMVVCIDAKNPGKLVVSNSAYDRKVAGIVSGAGGVRTGILMGQRAEAGEAPTIADGEVPIALTGRVYCWVDATTAAVTPGDLLTTSDTPGHAMKVVDHALAQGAVIGKAMTPLPKGQKGLVLVLVNMQ